MKPFIVLILACASLYGADHSTNTTPDITTKVTNIKGKNGHPDTRIETVYRGRAKVLMIMSHRDEKGGMAVTRAYLVGGKMVMSESDADGDGLLGSVTVLNPGTDEFEMFTRQPDGSVRPVSTATIEASKKQEAVADASLRTLLENPNMSSKEIEALLRENQEKISHIDKEKESKGK